MSYDLIRSLSNITMVILSYNININIIYISYFLYLLQHDRARHEMVRLVGRPAKPSSSNSEASDTLSSFGVDRESETSSGYSSGEDPNPSDAKGNQREVELVKLKRRVQTEKARAAAAVARAKRKASKYEDAPEHPAARFKPDLQPRPEINKPGNYSLVLRWRRLRVVFSWFQAWCSSLEKFLNTSAATANHCFTTNIVDDTNMVLSDVIDGSWLKSRVVSVMNNVESLVVCYKDGEDVCHKTFMVHTPPVCLPKTIKLQWYAGTLSKQTLHCTSTSGFWRTSNISVMVLPGYFRSLQLFVCFTRLHWHASQWFTTLQDCGHRWFAWVTSSRWAAFDINSAVHSSKLYVTTFDISKYLSLPRRPNLGDKLETAYAIWCLLTHHTVQSGAGCIWICCSMTTGIHRQICGPIGVADHVVEDLQSKREQTSPSCRSASTWCSYSGTVLQCHCWIGGSTHPGLFNMSTHLSPWQLTVFATSFRSLY